MKASVLDSSGSMMADRVVVATPYPCPPDLLVTTIAGLVKQLPPFERVSVGFPGVVRAGRVLSAPEFVKVGGLGTAVDADLVHAWDGYELADAVSHVLGQPTRVANDADVQGLGVISGTGLELVVTLGTSVGTGLFEDGRLAPHMEFAHHPFRDGETYYEQLGEAARKRLGDTQWNLRVQRAIETLDALFFFDHVYIGGGNSVRVTADLGPKASIVDNAAGILGGVRLWEQEQGNRMKPSINVITLAVGDLDRALGFYRDGLGLESSGVIGTEFPGDATNPAGAVVMFQLSGELVLALYPRQELAKDANIAVGPPKSGEFSIGHAVASKADVDTLLEQAAAAGATLTDRAHDRPWGIYSGYFHDPDGHLWEVMWNPPREGA